MGARSDEERSRPRAATGELEAAGAAVDGLVRELQDGWDRHDADITDRHLAADVVWGSPYGATVRGYETLHAIHLRLKRAGAGGRASRFEVVAVLPVAADVVVAQVRRAALDPDGTPVDPATDGAAGFSEMALYVLVRRADEWWLAAGQNTLLRPAPTSTG